MKTLKELLIQGRDAFHALVSGPNYHPATDEMIKVIVNDVADPLLTIITVEEMTHLWDTIVGDPELLDFFLQVGEAAKFAKIRKDAEKMTKKPIMSRDILETARQG